eukprot:scaffold19605_cov120-Skeletonema_menzelii.AAC.1
MPPKRARTSSSGALPSSSSKKKPPPSKRIVKIADDADLVLAQCRKLRDALRKKANDTSLAADDKSDDEWALDDVVSKATKPKEQSVTSISKSSSTTVGSTPKAKTQQLSLSELKTATSAGGKTIVEVVEMNSTEVMEGIENVAVKIAQQVLAKQGFQLDIPSRSASNQIYVPELDRIVLGDKR